MQKSKKQKNIQGLNKDSVYEIITFLAPYEVIQLLNLSKDWNEVITSNYWKYQCNKLWKIPSMIDNYYNYFKSRILFLENTSTSFGGRKSCSLYGKPMDHNIKIEWEVQFPIEIIQEASILFANHSFLINSSELYCFDFKNDKVVWKMEGLQEPTINYSLLFDVLVLKQKFNIMAIHPKTGRVIWRLETKEGCNNFIIKHNLIIFGDNERKNLSALNIETGEKLWSIEAKTSSNVIICSQGKKVIFCNSLKNAIMLNFQSFSNSPIVKDIVFDKEKDMGVILEAFICQNHLVMVSSLEDEDYFQCSINLETLKQKFFFKNEEYHPSSSFDEINGEIYTRTIVPGGGALWDVDISCYYIQNPQKKIEIHHVIDVDKMIKLYELEGKIDREYIDLYGGLRSNLIIHDHHIYFIAEWFEQKTFFCCFKNNGKKIIPVFLKELKGVVSFAEENTGTFYLWLEHDNFMIMNQKKLISIVQE